MTTVHVDPDSLLQYAAQAHTLGAELAAHQAPEVIAQPEQTTAPIVDAMHAMVVASSNVLSVIAHQYGTDVERAATMYVATDEENAARIQGVAL